MSVILPFLLSSVAAYLLGSISFSILITRLFAGTDIRNHGSGNAGATNVLRTAGKLPAILTFLLDFLKCVAAILIAAFIAKQFNFSIEYAIVLKYVTGIFCMVGHIFPLYFSFKGGKGVTTAAAIFLLLDWRCFVIAISLFIIIVTLMRIVSLGSILAAASTPLLTLFFQLPENRKTAIINTLLVSVIAIIVIVKHRENITRLLNGTEKRIGIKTK